MMNFMKTTTLVALLALFGMSSAWTPSFKSSSKPAVAQKTDHASFQPAVAAVAATAALCAMLSTAEPALASSTAAQVTLNSIPPTSIQVNIKDLPLVGEILSGTYTKVDTPVKNPSVVIASPKDKIGAIKAAATTGHLEFDVSGLLTTHLDIDAATEAAGIARIRVSSPLIPALPYKNAALPQPSSGIVTVKGGKESDWNIVTNMGSGDTYYFNEKSGKTQFEKPAMF